MGGLCGVSPRQAEPDQIHRQRRGEYALEKAERKVESVKVDKFADMEEYKDGRMIGEGVLRIPSYKCSLPFDALNELRKEFWASKRHSHVWLVLKSCCETDALSAKEFLSAEGLLCLGSNIRCVIQATSPEVLFHVPNFCICDPVYEKDFAACENTEGNTSTLFEVIVLYVFDNKETRLSVSSDTLGSELKKLYAERNEINLERFMLRMLHKGQEILDQHKLYFHNLGEGAKIQVAIRELSVG